MKTTACAVIVETRDLPGIEGIIAAQDKFLPSWFEETRWIKNEPINSMRDYNNLLTSKRFWRVMPDKVVIIQHDSMILREGIEEFLEWDFCGAPIPKIGWPCMNGGFSIRDTKAMLKVINHLPYQGMQVSGNEDIFLCNALRDLGGKLPTYEIAEKFSVETRYALGSIGYHQISAYLTPSECRAIENQYNQLI